ncbi:MAG TPA: hypothetical protein VLA04_02040 [Verrucomicrobiae bacterium]|nr:hypothetical protein [Verrucomicrobiae bacterium]
MDEAALEPSILPLEILHFWSVLLTWPLRWGAREPDCDLQSWSFDLECLVLWVVANNPEMLALTE